MSLAVLLPVPAIFTLACWLLSLRRTQFAIGWLALAAVAGLGGADAVLAVSEVHHTAAGLIGVALAGCVPAAIAVLAVESYGQEPPTESSVARWRAEHRDRPRRPSRARWRIEAQACESGVTLVLVDPEGKTVRQLGTADPLTDMDAFMELRARADQAAETMNALKVPR